jgi:hypothetical protein
MKPLDHNVDFENATFDLPNFMNNLNENGFDVHNVGGTHDDAFKHGEVYRFLNGQCQMLGKSGSILTCSANVFMKTLLDVESKFKYQLFG